MSNSLQLPNNTRIFYLFCISLICISFSSAAQLGVSPSEINFIGHSNKLICSNLTLISDFDTIRIIGYDLWNEEESRNMKDYKYDFDRSLFHLYYQNEFSFEGRKNIEICFVGYGGGEYYGLLIYEVKNGRVGVGSWIKAEIEGEVIEKDTMNNEKLLLKSRIESGRAEFNNKLIILEGLSSLVLMGLLAYMFYLLTK